VSGESTRPTPLVKRANRQKGERLTHLRIDRPRSRTPIHQGARSPGTQGEPAAEREQDPGGRRNSRPPPRRAPLELRSRKSGEARRKTSSVNATWKARSCFPNAPCSRSRGRKHPSEGPPSHPPHRGDEDRRRRREQRDVERDAPAGIDSGRSATAHQIQPSGAGYGARCETRKPVEGERLLSGEQRHIGPFIRPERIGGAWRRETSAPAMNARSASPRRTAGRHRREIPAEVSGQPLHQPERLTPADRSFQCWDFVDFESTPVGLHGHLASASSIRAGSRRRGAGSGGGCSASCRRIVRAERRTNAARGPSPRQSILERAPPVWRAP